ncbi:hypothetical protein IMSAGC006_02062 [Muribaculaceae bacterium]|nr:hypothetical protein IMSAGC006_02062 [Muribaculaceae bacterium]
MHVAETAVGQRVDLRGPLCHPSAIEQIVHGCLAYRFHHFLKHGSGSRRTYIQQRLMICESVEKDRKISIRGNRMAVDLSDDIAGAHSRCSAVQRATRHDFINLQTVSCVCEIEYGSEIGRSLVGRTAAVAAAGVAYIKFAQQLRQHFRIIMIVVYVRQEAAIMVHKTVPFHAVHVFHVEVLLLLVAHEFKHIFTLGGAVKRHAGGVAYV